MAQQGIKMPSWDELDDRVGLSPPVTPADARADFLDVEQGGYPFGPSSNQWPPMQPIPVGPSLPLSGDQIWQETGGETAMPIPPKGPQDKPTQIPGDAISKGLLKDPKQNIAFSPDAKPGPYVTELGVTQEKLFQNWVKANKVPWADSPTSDYDMRGFFKALQAGDKRAKTAINQKDKKLHYPDTWKTPYHKTFSNQSIYATKNAPHWEGNKLIDKNGKVIADETPQAQ